MGPRRGKGRGKGQDKKKDENKKDEKKDEKEEEEVQPMNYSKNQGYDQNSHWQILVPLPAIVVWTCSAPPAQEHVP